jgi:signal transduction histidine kinase
VSPKHDILNGPQVAEIRLKDFSERSRAGGPFYLLGFLGTALVSAEVRQEAGFVSAVVVVFTLLLIARFFFAARVAATQSVYNSHCLQCFVVIYIASALLWSMSSAWVYYLNSTINIVITINVMATAGITTGGMSALISFPRLLKIHCFLMIVPLAIAAGLLLQGPGNWLIGSFIAGYGLFTWMLGRQQSKAYSQRLDDNVKLYEQAEELKSAKLAAEKAGQAKADFLAAMTHEIRTPMNGVLGMAQLLAMGDLSEEHKQQVAVINNAGVTLLHIIDNILDYSKIDAGKLTLEIHSFNPGNVLNEARQLLASQAADKSIQLNTSATDVPELIKGDPYRFYQILFNLVGNSIKFTDQGSVTVEMTSSATDQQGNGVITLRVSDTGIGISEQDQKSIFEQFHQVSQFSPDIRGTGLGLTITQSLIELMGGTISLQSRVGVGTVFTVELPFLVASEAPPDSLAVAVQHQQQAVLAGDQTPCKVLVVEDNAVNQMVCEQFLLKLGCTVDIAESGKVALDKYNQTRYQLIFMDCNMPEMDGFVATEAIRTLEQTNKLPATPIIALTAHVQDEVRQRCLLVGMNGFLSKPFLFVELKKIIDDIRAAS